MRGQSDWIYHLWQWVQHARLHSDLLQALNGEHLTVPGFQQREPEFLSQYHVCIGEEWSQINLKMSIGVWSTLPIFLPVYLHSSLSLQCHAQRTYLFTLIWLNSMSIFIIILKKTKTKNMCTHILVYASTSDLVYLLISITGIVATPKPIHSTTSLVNKLETPIICIYICKMSLRLTNNGNTNLATNMYAYVVNWENSGHLHHESCLFWN